MQKQKVVFFGSGPVAARSLELLLVNFDVIAVVTKPKPGHHRGDFPVIDIAENNNLNLYTVRNRKELSSLISDKPFESELAILVDFGIIVSHDVIDYFPRGIINSHFSLLPEWRGADPISFAILSGQSRTGVSLMLLVEAMDEGPIIGCGIQELSGKETTPQLTDKLILLSDSLLKELVPKYLLENKTTDQFILSKLIADYPSEASYSRKLTKADGILDFNKPALDLEREIRAFIDWPKSRTKLAGIDVIITSAKVVKNSGKAGDITVKDKQLIINCGKDALLIKTLKPAGKGEMTGQSFIAGYGARL